jgi:NADPH:quinone reductase-like Zn-dependent oxidoreductase
MNTNVMKALRFTGFGPPSVLRIEEVAIPEAGEGETLVHVKAAAIDPSDIGNVAGRFKKTTLQRTPGRDFAGIVVKGSITKVKRSGGVPRRSVSQVTDPTRKMSLSQRRRCRCGGV